MVTSYVITFSTWRSRGALPELRVLGVSRRAFVAQHAAIRQSSQSPPSRLSAPGRGGKAGWVGTLGRTLCVGEVPPHPVQPQHRFTGLARRKRK